MGSRSFRLNLWRFALGLLLLIAFLTFWVWSRGEMVDRGLWRTLAWTGLGGLMLLFLYPRKGQRGSGRDDGVTAKRGP